MRHESDPDRPALRRPAKLAVGGALLAAVVLATALLALPHSATPSRIGPHPRDRGAGARAAPRAGLHGGADPARPLLIPTRAPVGRAVEVTVGSTPAGHPVPGDPLGLSFELRSLPLIARYAAPRGDLVALLRSLGPGVLRFGGVSADEGTAWVETGARRPSWASTAITPRDLTGIATLARETGWRVLLTVNLGHYDPRAAAQEAAAARAALGSALVAIAVGNEPDRYVRKRLRAAGWDFSRYRSQATAYRAAIEAAAPGTPIAGPDPATGVPGLAWLRAAARSLRPALLTDHYYPLSSCGYRPTVGELLSPNLRTGADTMLEAMLATARAARTPLRIDETNDISCEGRPGVSDTFASALWALDYIARALRAGVAGLNFHDLLSKPGSYSPLLAPTPSALAAGALHAQPEWYALLAARELAGSVPLPARVDGATSGALSASAFRDTDGRLRLVLVDYAPPGSRPLAVRLRLRSRTRMHARGSILRLTAPSPIANGGVKLGGRAVAAGGSWSAPSRLPALYGDAGKLSLQLDPSSAAVVTLYPR